MHGVTPPQYAGCFFVFSDLPFHIGYSDHTFAVIKLHRDNNVFLPNHKSKKTKQRFFRNAALFDDMSLVTRRGIEPLFPP